MEHLKDKIRVEVAQNFIRREMRKLLPSIDKKSVWNVIDNDLDSLIDGGVNLRPVWDFWCVFDAFSRTIRHKNLINFLTSTNIEWSILDVDVEKLSFGTKIVLKNFPSIRACENKKYLYKKENKDLLKQLKKGFEERRSESFEREKGYVIAFQKYQSDEIIVLDGNRRLFDAIVFDQNKINVALGKVVGIPRFKDYFVAPAIFNELLYRQTRLEKRGEGNNESLMQVLYFMTKDSVLAQKELFNTALINYPNKKIEMRVKELLNK